VSVAFVIQHVNRIFSVPQIVRKETHSGSLRGTNEYLHYKDDRNRDGGGSNRRCTVCGSLAGNTWTAKGQNKQTKHNRTKAGMKAPPRKHMCVCVYVCTYTHTHIRVWAVYIYIYIHTHTYITNVIFIHIHKYVFRRYIYIYIYAYNECDTHIHIHTHI